MHKSDIFYEWLELEKIEKEENHAILIEDAEKARQKVIKNQILINALSEEIQKYTKNIFDNNAKIPFENNSNYLGKQDQLTIKTTEKKSFHSTLIGPAKRLAKSKQAVWEVFQISNQSTGLMIKDIASILQQNYQINLVHKTIERAIEDLIIERILSRKRSDDTLTEESIRQKLRREWGEGEPEEGQQVGKCIAMADYTFENTMPMNEVEEEFNKEILSKI